VHVQIGVAAGLHHNAAGQADAWLVIRSSNGIYSASSDDGTSPRGWYESNTLVVDRVRSIMTVNTIEMPFKLGLMRRNDPRVGSLMAQKQGGENARQALLQTQTQYNTPYVAVVKAWIGIFGTPCNAPPWGHLTADDLKTQKVL